MKVQKEFCVVFLSPYLGGFVLVQPIQRDRWTGAVAALLTPDFSTSALFAFKGKGGH